MNRRNFLKSLGTAVAAANIFLPRAADAFRWKRSLPGGVWVLNPEWVTAPYEIRFERGLMVIVKRSFEDTPTDVYPLRLGKRDGALIPVAEITPLTFSQDSRY